LLADSGSRRSLGLAGRLYAEGTFSSMRVADRFERILRGCLAPEEPARELSPSLSRAA